METKLLTYAELAKALGITAASAKRLAIRKAWQKTTGNDGKARVAVPVERLAESGGGDSGGDAAGVIAGVIARDATSDDAGAVTSDTPPAPDSTRQLIAHLEGRITELTGELKDARETIATLNETAKRVDALAAEARGLQALLEAERKRSEELRADGMRWQGQAEKALAAVPIPQPEKRGFLRRLFG